MFILTKEEVQYCEAVSKSGAASNPVSGLVYNNSFFVKVKHYETSEYDEAIKDCRENFLDNTEKQVPTLLIKEDDSVSIWTQDTRYQPQGAVIGRATKAKADSPSSTGNSTIEKVVAKMRSKGGISIKTRRHKLMLHHHCFVGSEAVDWMVKNLKISREKAVKFGQQLVKAKIVHHIKDEHDFKDEELFYRFYEDEDKKIWNDKIV